MRSAFTAADITEHIQFAIERFDDDLEYKHFISADDMCNVSDIAVSPENDMDPSILRRKTWREKSMTTSMKIFGRRIVKWSRI